MPHIESALPADAPLLWALRQNREDWMARQSIDQWEPNSRSLRWFDQSVRQDDWWVVRGDGDVTAAVRIAWSDSLWTEQGGEAAYLHDLMVSSAASGQGLGRLLIEHVDEQAKARGLNVVRLDCMESNAELVGYYERSGFVVVGRATEPYPHRGEWAWAALMEKAV